MHRRHARLAGLLAIAFGLAIGCGPSDEEQAFEQATAALAKARSGVEAARADVDAEEKKVAGAQAELGKAEERLAEATRSLEEARARVGRHATDDVLFRTVQAKLLEDPTLAHVAIRARVEKGVVFLSGEVPEEKLRERAEDLAASTPGVVGVDNRVVVAAKEPPPAEG
jgi:osmotically-inducible protein OsmY